MQGNYIFNGEHQVIEADNLHEALARHQSQGDKYSQNGRQQPTPATLLCWGMEIIPIVAVNALKYVLLILEAHQALFPTFGAFKGIFSRHNAFLQNHAGWGLGGQ